MVRHSSFETADGLFLVVAYPVSLWAFAYETISFLETVDIAFYDEHSKSGYFMLTVLPTI